MAAATTIEDKPLNQIPLRAWDINENSTHYDQLVAAPSDSDLFKMWSSWAALTFLTGIITTAVLIPVVTSKKAMRNPFNLYLVFLMLPDACVAFACALSCTTNAMAGHFTSDWGCYLQSFYLVFSIGTNCWLNALITWHIWRMLSSSQNFRRYKPPTHKRILKETALVYLYGAFLAGMGMLNDVSWWPHKTQLVIGAACLPMDFSTGSTVFFYCCFFPLLFGIPVSYVCYVIYQIWKQGMLPPPGRRRTLAIYFIRLAVVFLGMWAPGLLFMFVLPHAFAHPWLFFGGGSWSHLQGFASTVVSLMKPDIQEAVKSFWCCCIMPNKDTTATGDSNVLSSMEEKSTLEIAGEEGGRSKKKKKRERTWSSSFRQSFPSLRSSITNTSRLLAFSNDNSTTTVEATHRGRFSSNLVSVEENHSGHNNANLVYEEESSNNDDMDLSIGQIRRMVDGEMEDGSEPKKNRMLGNPADDESEEDDPMDFSIGQLRRMVESDDEEEAKKDKMLGDHADEESLEEDPLDFTRRAVVSDSESDDDEESRRAGRYPSHLVSGQGVPVKEDPIPEDSLNFSIGRLRRMTEEEVDEKFDDEEESRSGQYLSHLTATANKNEPPKEESPLEDDSMNFSIGRLRRMVEGDDE